MDYVIETDFEGPGFVAVPNHVAQRKGISPEALGLLVYLASQPRGFIARWSVICAHFGMGKDRWQRIARELRAVGAMDVQQIRGAGGRVIGRRVAVRWPAVPAVETVSVTESRETRLSDRKPGKPAAGKSAKLSGENRQVERANPAPYKDQIKKQGAQVRTASRRQHPDGCGGSPSRIVNGRREYRGPDGSFYRRPDDDREAVAFDAWIATAGRAEGAEKKVFS